jgi:hypothetical protein
MQQSFEKYFEQLDSYSEMLKVAQDMGKPNVSSAAWDMTRKYPMLSEVYRFDESRFEEYFEMGSPEKTEPDTLTFFTKQHGQAFALRWMDDHFDIQTFGQYF